MGAKILYSPSLQIYCPDVGDDREPLSLSRKHTRTSNLTEAGAVNKRPESQGRSLDDRGSDNSILCLLF